MVAFNFRAMHADKVISGEKCTTIRPTKRSKPGDTLQLYTGMRTRRVKLLKIARCVDVRKVTIHKDHIKGIDEFDPDEFMEMEGFEGESLESFIEFFEKQYGLPFNGYLYIWTDKIDHKKRLQIEKGSQRAPL